MKNETPFVVVLAAAASRVGQSTLAENLAVYLKGFAEDLPVGLISFDPAQNPAQTFALPGSATRPPATRFRTAGFDLCLTLGQFGVEYLHAGGLLAFSAGQLRRGLGCGQFSGILIIDAGPLSSAAARAALQTADLVLTPVQNAAGLAALAQIRRELKAGGGNDQMLWLVPSMVDNLNTQKHSLDFLRFAAQERGCQVLDKEFALDEGLPQKTRGVGGSVLTRMSESPAHQLCVAMAQLVLQKSEQGSDTACRLHRLRVDKVLPPRSQRIGLLCPLCQKLAHAQLSHYCEALPQRRRWLVHAACREKLIKNSPAEPFWQAEQVTVLRTGVEVRGLIPSLRLLVAENDGSLLESFVFQPAVDSGWHDLIRHATGRTLAEQQPALLIIYPPVSADRIFSSEWMRQCNRLRKRLRATLAPEF